MSVLYEQREGFLLIYNFVQTFIFLYYFLLTYLKCLLTQASQVRKAAQVSKNLQNLK